VDAVQEARSKGIDKPMVVALAGDTEVEEAARFLEDNGIPAYPYAAEKAVAALGAKYRFWRSKVMACP
jgi:acyl-CoA synthetase (NDP forming)